MAGTHDFCRMANGVKKRKSMKFIEEELNWLAKILVARINDYFRQEKSEQQESGILPQSVGMEDGAYARFIQSNNLSFEDRVFLILSFVPLLRPQMMDCFNVKNSDTGLRFVEFGCEENGASGLIPTLETVLFILTGGNVNERIKLMNYFLQHPVFSNPSYFKMDGESKLVTMKIEPSEELVDLLILEKPFIPHFSSSFPARKVETNRDWSELVLDDNTMKLVNEIKLWVKYGDRIRKEWGLGNKVKPGFRALFHGPSGSGKTFTATLLGKETGRDVYCVDLSMVISKYIGETEKNLSKVFEMAEGRDWILFFDEADALFGKRTGMKDAHDRYANQEVAYLLQRIEGFQGLVVLSTNLKSNMDDAFARRFQSVIRFPMPDAEQRERLWRGTFSKETKFEPAVDLKTISSKYELAGGSILNVVQYCSIMAMSRGEKIIRNEDILEGIRRELLKEGKMMG